MKSLTSLRVGIESKEPFRDTASAPAAIASDPASLRAQSSILSSEHARYKIPKEHISSSCFILESNFMRPGPIWPAATSHNGLLLSTGQREEL